MMSFKTSKLIVVKGNKKRRKKKGTAGLIGRSYTCASFFCSS
jgi:hypothetical protein